MLVSEHFEIDEDELFLKAEKEDTDYWTNSSKFYSEVKNKDITKITNKQQDWLTTIETSLKGEN